MFEIYLSGAQLAAELFDDRLTHLSPNADTLRCSVIFRLPEWEWDRIRNALTAEELADAFMHRSILECGPAFDSPEELKQYVLGIVETLSRLENEHGRS